MPRPPPPLRWAIRVLLAAVWIGSGLLFKVLGLVPRHEAIVGRILGASHAHALTVAIGAAEIVAGVWILSGRWPRTCMLAQTVAIAAMNALELTFARDLLLAPIPMVLANAALLSAGWWAALPAPRPRP